jgi:hypothetical protein
MGVNELTRENSVIRGSMTGFVVFVAYGMKRIVRKVFEGSGGMMGLEGSEYNHSRDGINYWHCSASIVLQCQYGVSI